MDDIERAAIIDAGYNPDDPTVTQAMDLVRYDLAMLGHLDDTDLSVDL